MNFCSSVCVFSLAPRRLSVARMARWMSSRFLTDASRRARRARRARRRRRVTVARTARSKLHPAPPHRRNLVFPLRLERRDAFSQPNLLRSDVLIEAPRRRLFHSKL